MKRIRFEIRMWRLRKVIRLELSIKSTMGKLDLDYDDVNLRHIHKLEVNEIEKWLMNNSIN